MLADPRRRIVAVEDFGERRLIQQRRLLAGARKPCHEVREGPLQALHQVDARTRELQAELDVLAGPDLQTGQRGVAVGVEAAFGRAELLEQGRTLLGDVREALQLVCITAHEHRRGLVHELPARARITRHEALVVRRERDERDHAGDVAHVARRAAVDARAVGAFRADRGLDCGGRLIRFVADVRADRGLRVAALHERQRRRGAVARPRGEHFERLHDVGLAQAIGPLQDGDAGGQVEQAMIP